MRVFLSSVYFLRVHTTIWKSSDCLPNNLKEFRLWFRLFAKWSEKNQIVPQTIWKNSYCFWEVPFYLFGPLFEISTSCKKKTNWRSRKNQQEDMISSVKNQKCDKLFYTCLEKTKIGLISGGAKKNVIFWFYLFFK